MPHDKPKKKASLPSWCRQPPACVHGTEASSYFYRRWPNAVGGGGGSWQRSSLCTVPGLRPGSSPRTWASRLVVEPAGWRASPHLPRSSRPRSPHHHQQHLVLLPGCPRWQCPASPTRQGELRNKPKCPHCAGCRSTAKNSESAPPALNHEISLQVTRVMFCVRGARERPVPHPRRLLWAPPRKGLCKAASREPKPRQANTLPTCCASRGNGWLLGTPTLWLLSTPAFAAAQCITQANLSPLEQAVVTQLQAIHSRV